MLGIFKKHDSDTPLLDKAVRLLRESTSIRGNDTLSGVTRAAILERSVRASDPADVHSISFIPSWKLMVTAGCSIAVTAALVVASRNQGAVDRNHTVELVASKDGGDVVFELRDGQGPHRVRKSTDVTNFRARAVTVENGRFRDLAESGPVLVFYRVD